MAEYLRQHMEVWLAITALLAVMDYFLFREFRKRTGTDTASTARSIHTLRYAQLADPGARIYGHAIFALRAFYLCWFLFALWLIFFADRSSS